MTDEDRLRKAFDSWRKMWVDKPEPKIFFLGVFAGIWAAASEFDLEDLEQEIHEFVEREVR